MYNYSALADGSNIVEWSAVINSWTGNMLFPTFIIIGALITYFIVSRSGGEPSTALVSSSFAWGLMSALLWSVEWNGYILIPTVIPILFGILLGVGVIMKLMSNSIGNI